MQSSPARPSWFTAVAGVGAWAGACAGAWFSRLPGCCAVCHGWCHQRVCPECVHHFARPTPRCEQCAARVVPGVAVCGACLSTPPPFDAAWAAVDYAFPWATLVARFKFQQALDLARPFADLMESAAPPGALAATGPRWILPVPLSRARLHQRGYNQAWELARRLARRLDWPTRPDLLLKTRDTPEQMALPPTQRRANVRRAFGVNPALRHHLQGAAVVLVDDVMTTGATAGEIARLLKEEAGARSVTPWVFARTPAPKGP
jgi:ComF family protein